MTLDSKPRHPAVLSYVLKLDSASASGRPLSGRLESVTTGRVRTFGTAAELLDCLAEELAEAPSTGARG